MIGICHLCPSPATGTCSHCGRLVCEKHYNSRTGICNACLRGRQMAS